MSYCPKWGRGSGRFSQSLNFVKFFESIPKWKEWESDEHRIIIIIINKNRENREQKIHILDDMEQNERTFPENIT